jgi:cytoskeletal protein RodZ
MPKRDPEIETVDGEEIEAEVPTVGERLRAAREEKGLTLEDVAAQTRIPQRHLASIETAEWDSLPAPTYTLGFAKSYASIVGLDRVDIGNQLREEMGGQRFAATSSDAFEPADPARTMPRGLVVGAILAVVVLIALMSWLNSRSLDQSDEPVANEPAVAASAQPGPQPAPPVAAASAQGPVVLTATAPAWIQVTDQGKSLFQGELQPGQTYTVPPTATAPVLKAGKPEALTVTVGSTTAPPVGPAGRVATASLLPADLLKGPAAATPQSQTAAPRAQAPVRAPTAEADTNTAQ